MAGLEDYRREIDEIDGKMIALFEQRLELVLKVAAYKKEHSMEVFQGNREAQVLEKAVAHLSNKDYSEEAIKLMNSLMEISRRVQQRILESAAILQEESTGGNHTAVCSDPSSSESTGVVGIQGVSGSFAEQALEARFGTDCKRINVSEFEDVFLALIAGEIDYGVLPIENSSTGAVTETYDLLRKYDCFIVGEQYVAIQQNLMGIPGTTISEIREVYSHRQGLGQSSEYLKEHSDWLKIPYHNTAFSAKMVKEDGDRHKAAIASKKAAELYGLEILEANINNEKDNTTRFVIVARTLEIPFGADKISVVFSLEDKAGSLFGFLRSFAENHINLLKIESRPMRDQTWKDCLYMDFEGNIENHLVQEALAQIKREAGYFQLLGVYKKELEV